MIKFKIQDHISHYRLEHCSFNVLVQLALGIPLEMVHGGLRVGAIYVAGVVAGKLFIYAKKSKKIISLFRYLLPVDKHHCFW